MTPPPPPLRRSPRARRRPEPPAPHVHMRVKGRLGNQLFQFWMGAWLAERTGLPLTVSRTCDWFLQPRHFPNLRRVVGTMYRTLVPIPRGRYHLRGGPTSGAGAGAGTRIYSCADGAMGETIMLDVRRILAASRAAGHAETILLNVYNECFTFIEPHAAYVRRLYERPSRALGRLDATVVHVRLGDLTDQYAASAPSFSRFVCDLCSREPGVSGTEVVIVAEDPYHRRVRALERALLRTRAVPGVRVARRRCRRGRPGRAGGGGAGDGGVEAVHSDFDLLYRARNVVMANSTFSWWAAWLNPFAPSVYVGLSAEQPFAAHRTPWMFVNGPPDWNLYDLDARAWVRRRRA